MKKLLLPACLALTCLSTATVAGQFYIGPTAFLQTITAKNSNYFGIHPALSLGYGRMCGKYYLSGEIFAVPVAGTIATSISHHGVNTKTTYGFGASFIPGMHFGTNKTGFLRLGIINSWFPGGNTSKNGLQMGFGVLSPLNAKWDLRLEYVFTTYQSMTGLGSPKSNEIGLGVIYKLGQPTTT